MIKQILHYLDLNKKSKQFSPGLGKPLMEKSGDYDVFDSSELESSEMKEIEYINKLRLLEYFLSQLSLNHDLSRPVFKRGFSRSLGKDDRRRPGWELAYGKKKRSIN